MKPWSCRENIYLKLIDAFQIAVYSVRKPVLRIRIHWIRICYKAFLVNPIQIHFLMTTNSIQFYSCKKFNFLIKIWTIFILRPLWRALDYSWETSPAPQKEHLALQNIKFLHFTPLFCGPRSETLTCTQYVYTEMRTFKHQCDLVWKRFDLKNSDTWRVRKYNPINNDKLLLNEDIFSLVYEIAPFFSFR